MGCTRTLVRCSEDKASVHRTPVLPPELNSATFTQIVTITSSLILERLEFWVLISSLKLLSAFFFFYVFNHILTQYICFYSGKTWWYILQHWRLLQGSDPGDPKGRKTEKDALWLPTPKRRRETVEINNLLYYHSFLLKYHKSLETHLENPLKYLTGFLVNI